MKDQYIQKSVSICIATICADSWGCVANGQDVCSGQTVKKRLQDTYRNGQRETLQANNTAISRS